MGEPGRLDLVQDALHTLIDQLRRHRPVAIVAYEDEARVLREMTPVRSRAGPARRRRRPRAGRQHQPGGRPRHRLPGGPGRLRRGATNRVILLSDGLANVGNTTAEPILRQIREEAAKQIALLGVGVGSEYGDALMERLADEGDGFVTTSPSGSRRGGCSSTDCRRR